MLGRHDYFINIFLFLNSAKISINSLFFSSSGSGEKGMGKLSENNRSKKLARSLSFSSILPTKKGKLKISKFDESTKLKSVEENSELTSFCDTLKRNRTLKDKVLKKNTVTETSMRRLSIVCNEIERFEREFVEPVRKSSSSLSLAGAFNSRVGSREEGEVMRKHSSVTRLPGAGKMPWKYLSTDSMSTLATSGYNSAGLSRESTPDLSIRSNSTEASSSQTDGDSQKLSQPEKTELQTTSVLRRKPFCSTPRKPKRSHSEKLVSRCPPGNPLRRSHTTACGDLQHLLVSKRRSSAPAQHIYISVGCSSECQSKVTVNGLCYH